MILVMLFAMFAIVGFVVMARWMGLVLVRVLTHLLAIIPLMVKLVIAVVRRSLWAVFVAILLADKLMLKLYFAFRHTVSLLARGVEGLFQGTPEPRFNRVPSASAVPGRTTRREWFPAMRAIGWSWVAPTCILGTFLSLNGTFDELKQRWEPQWRRRAQNVLPRTAAKPVLDSLATPDSVPAANTERPTWITDPPKSDQDSTSVVVTSGLWSTLEEAKVELSSKAKTLLDADFRQRHHSRLDPKLERLLSDDQVERAVVKQRFVEEIPMDFGSMNRLWWLVEISPSVRTDLYANWNTARIKNRVLFLGLGLAFVTLIANASGLFVTLKRAAQYGSLRALATTTACVVAWSSLGFCMTRFML